MLFALALLLAGAAPDVAEEAAAKARALPPFTPCAECRDACSDAAREPDCRRLCEGGKPTACTMLAAHQLIDSKGKSIDRAVALLEKAAAAHDPSAAGTLG